MQFDRILELMDQKGISQKKLAELLGVCPQKISDWKKGTVRSWDKRLPQIADALGVTVDELIGNEKKPTTKIDRELTPDEERFILWLRSLSDEQRKFLEAMYNA